MRGKSDQAGVGHLGDGDGDADGDSEGNARNFRLPRALPLPLPSLVYPEPCFSYSLGFSILR